MKTFVDWAMSRLVEDVGNTRYSVETNFRTKTNEALEAFAKIVLGYVSAAMKRHGFHIRQVFSETPPRIMVSSRNWDDGEWVGLVAFNPHQSKSPQESCFVISSGFYNKDRRTVAVQKTHRCAGHSAAEISRELYNLMHHLKGVPDRHREKLKPVPLKRGPKT